jgi:hypothetical protein
MNNQQLKKELEGFSWWAWFRVWLSLIFAGLLTYLLVSHSGLSLAWRIMDALAVLAHLSLTWWNLHFIEQLQKDIQSLPQP